MRITSTTLVDLLDEQKFVGIYSEYVKDVFGTIRLFPQLHLQRLIEAHGAWLNDLKRVGDHEPNLDQGLDHFKQAAHLAFWLRRMTPVVEAHDLSAHPGDAPGYPLTREEQQFRDLLFGYKNEYLAFDFGYQICKYHELAKPGGSMRAKALLPMTDYYKIACHFLKYKTVSPHSIYLIYMSLFLATHNDAP
jgi:hypothetical protein